MNLGEGNGTKVVVKQGLKPGEHVVVDPTHLLTEAERWKAIWYPPAARKKAGADKAKAKASGN